MRIAIKPPVYWPRLSYVALMQSVDVFVLGDTFQYSRQSYHNRARIRTPQGWHWITVPLVGRQHGRPIIDTKIDNRTHWGSKHLRSIIFNYSQSAFFPFVEDAITELYNQDWEKLAGLTCQTVSLLHEMFQMSCRLVRASELDGYPQSVEEILKVIPVTERVIEHEREDDGRGLSRLFTFDEPLYRQHFEGFEQNITAMDLICNYGPEAAGIVRGAMMG